ncbi:D-alanine--D-alanine ligase [Propionicimonas sp.]|uniref:D-alanine--D-alanine ligase family protein n=1 Tax=Propionicimonas sp. TaxID=1955623 RepID=UPI001840467E|nr:D-alanine--D-alanine ligase [Propionicimonas sp.]MBU3976350.1 D-alanine--D-alanine ligase [Actinomycetota bacterium]MBA3022057.1 D-alanine--D-alanine ligase [Propionicimonas sp.]MBU3987507.1 D-alanine--D-alanine ligase [Actinomycetota bacterium]MBU4006548.1 D-alanine--D-alanine ligase [Actinomycetota bacterium]MBU4065153.1 D-alanine--D-alanine ligase [Actinomycetota bacterium]
MNDTQAHGPIVVLAGGLSHEREVSLRSGRRVAQALRDQGREVIESDLNAGLIELLHGLKNPVVFPLLHGGVGEDGGLQQVLNLLEVAYVGSSPAAARRSFNKAIAGPLVAQAGINTAASVALPHDMFRELGAAALVTALGERFGFPLMVKPARSGSALGCSMVNSVDELPAAMVGAYAYGDVTVVEQFIVGTEVAVSVVELDGKTVALPAVEIRPNSGIYDYTARYTAGETRFIVPAELSADVAKACADLAISAHQVLGLQGHSRADIIVTDDGTPVFIEANSAPGMTETSLFPQAVEAAGWDFGLLCSQLVDNAWARHVG